MTIQCTDGVIDDATLRKWGATLPDISVQQSVSEIRACFVGSSMNRAIALAQLSVTVRVRLYSDRPHIARWLARIARGITGPTARAELQRAPTKALLFAARSNDENAQIRRAYAFWILGAEHCARHF